jgi:Protein of unknown function DUF262
MKTIASTPLIGGTLEFKPVMKIRGKFMVPAYQRGYRWGEEEVSQLVEDIAANAEQDYCLQPVVVKALNDDNWELIDGQQRLTTLLLLVRALGETPPWTMEFETRPSSTDFIGDPCATRAGENIDFHHIFTAHKTIVRRLDSLNSRDREAMHEALKERVQVIWYEAPADAQSVELFTRLNSGRIQLDDAELFKALLLARLLAGDERDTADATDHLRANEVAVQWDSIERDLRRRNLWAFLAANRTCATHISLLLEIVADVRARDAAGSFRVFHALREKVEKGTAGEVWARVVSLHERALGWYADLEQFHKIGFLIAQAGGEARDEVLRKVATTAAHETRTAFRAWLTNQIRKELGVSDTELDTLRYDKDRTRAQRLLLLMNVETMGQMNVETKSQQLNREARYPFAAHHTLRWSVEHIHAQQAPELNRIKQWQAWIDEHKHAVEAVPDTDDRKGFARPDKTVDALDVLAQC